MYNEEIEEEDEDDGDEEEPSSERRTSSSLSSLGQPVPPHHPFQYHHLRGGNSSSLRSHMSPQSVESHTIHAKSPSQQQNSFSPLRVPPLDRTRFNGSYKHFCQTKKLVLDDRLMAIQGCTIDLHLLHVEVMNAGGPQRVCASCFCLVYLCLTTSKGFHSGSLACNCG